MKWIDQIFGQSMEGSKTEYLAFAASLVGAIVLGLNMFLGIEIGPEWVSSLENVVAIGLALTLGARVSRNTELTKKVEMNQPASDKNVGVVPSVTEEKKDDV